ncbi:GNAT family N-acetyltransferase [bacterium CG_4_9_14_3_um_filter_65_15]|nr:MAG: GNAT family N-acetyltransferase [bacterium CG_4_9_14_3_um_filter_65_15]
MSHESENNTKIGGHQEPNGPPAAVVRRAESPADILKVMVVRGIVFIEEQGVDWDGEIDGFEDESVHVLGEADGEPVASGRLRMLPDGWAKLERVAVRPRWRGRGIARQVVDFLLAEAGRRGATRFKLHAQVYLEKFYAEFGFTREGAVFDECGIDHILMLRDDRPAD